MVQTKHKHKRSGGYVEVRSSSTATYKEFAEMAANALNLEEIGISEDEDQILTENELALFRCDGTRVLDTPINESTKWSIHEYMSTFPSFTRTGTAIKLGVGYTSSRTVSHLNYLIIFDCMCACNYIIIMHLQIVLFCISYIALSWYT